MPKRRLATILPALALAALLAAGCAAGQIAATALPDLKAPTPTPSPTLDATLTGDLEQQVRFLEETMPLAGSQKFVVPGEADQANFMDLFAALSAGDLERTAELATHSNYEVLRFEDRGDEHAPTILLRASPSAQTSWGLYAFRTGSAGDFIIEAPHPLSDAGTSLLALRLYRALDARALLIAGAHRNANADGSADVAHAVPSIFQSAHIAVLHNPGPTSTAPVVLQVHGFAARKHPGYPDVIISYSRGPGDELLEDPQTDAIMDALAAALEERRISVGICRAGAWRDLCGTTNVQASAMYGDLFIHLELSEAVRKKDDGLIEALRQALIR